MPFLSSSGSYTFSNLGPLTTTFSAAASCATGTDHAAVALVSTPGPEPLLDFSLDCSVRPLGSCFPSGPGVDSFASEVQTNPAAATRIQYFSPGLICPSNWATIGTVGRATGIGGYTSTGVFTAPTPAPTQLFNPSLNILYNAIDPGETAVACCPRCVLYFYV